MKTRREPIDKSADYLSAWGNENIIRNHVAYFEKHLEEEVAQQKGLGPNASLAFYPNFAAWIRFYTELICNSLYWRLLRDEGDWDWLSNMKFIDIRKRAFEKVRHHASRISPKIDERTLESMMKSLDLVLNLRHFFQHGGLPNLWRNLTLGVNEIEFMGLLDPDNYVRTNQVFREADKLLSLLPQPTIVFYSTKAEEGRSSSEINGSSFC